MIKLTPESVGRVRVTLASGYIGILVGYCPDSVYPYYINGWLSFNEIGEAMDDDRGLFSIIEVKDITPAMPEG